MLYGKRKTIATITSKGRLHGNLSQILLNTADKLLYHLWTKRVKNFYSSLNQLSKLLDKQHNGPSISDNLYNLKSNRIQKLWQKHRLYLIADNLFQKRNVRWKNQSRIFFLVRTTCTELTEIPAFFSFTHTIKLRKCFSVLYNLCTLITDFKTSIL